MGRFWEMGFEERETEAIKPSIKQSMGAYGLPFPASVHLLHSRVDTLSTHPHPPIRDLDLVVILFAFCLLLRNQTH